MLQSTVINKLSLECAVALGDLDHLQTIHIYIQMALSIGVEHYTKDMEEIVVMDTHGVEAGRYKSISEAVKELGIRQGDISAVLTSRQHTAGGYMFMKTKDYELVPRKDSNKPKLKIIPLK